MYLNDSRKTVAQWLTDDGTLRPDASHCPECRGLLVAVRGDHMRWHWRHHASHRARDCTMFGGESEWHLAMKDAHAEAGFEVEYSVSINATQSLRFDAFSETGAAYPIREFIHSLSPSYLAKSDALRDVSEHVVWVFDGNEFASARAKRTRDRKGMRCLLKPRAWDYAAYFANNQQKVIIDYHWGWELWGNNVWYNVDNTFAPLMPRHREQLAYQREREALLVDSADEIFGPPTRIEMLKAHFMNRRNGYLA